jgi:hypothetical protein
MYEWPCGGSTCRASAPPRLRAAAPRQALRAQALRSDPQHARLNGASLVRTDPCCGAGLHARLNSTGIHIDSPFAYFPFVYYIYTRCCSYKVVELDCEGTIIYYPRRVAGGGGGGHARGGGGGGGLPARAVHRGLRPAGGGVARRRPTDGAADAGQPNATLSFYTYTVVGYHSLGIYIRILLSVLSLAVKMTLSPLANAGGRPGAVQADIDALGLALHQRRATLLLRLLLVRRRARAGAAAQALPGAPRRESRDAGRRRRRGRGGGGTAPSEGRRVLRGGGAR